MVNVVTTLYWGGDSREKLLDAIEDLKLDFLVMGSIEDAARKCEHICDDTFTLPCNHCEGFALPKVTRSTYNGLSGPIPSGIGLLGSITDLRISDLSNGTETPFPPLSNMKNLKTLILGSCNIVGQLPDFLGQLPSLVSATTH